MKSVSKYTPAYKPPAYKPRLQIELDSDQVMALNRLLRPGERTTLYRAITRDLIELMEKIGPGMVLAGVINGDLKIEEYTRIARGLKQIFEQLDNV